MSQARQRARRLLLQSGPFDGAALSDDAPPAKLCASHTNRDPADKATREQLRAADQSQCAIYVRVRPMPKEGPVPYRYDRAHRGRLDLNCRFKLIDARHAAALAKIEAHEAANDRAAPGKAPLKELPGGDEGEEWRED